MIYKCSQHGQWLVDYVRLIRGRPEQDTFFVLPYMACPVPGCNHIKPNKWRKAWAADQNEVIVLQLLKDGVPAELMSKLRHLVAVNKFPTENDLKRELGNHLAKKCGESR